MVLNRRNISAFIIALLLLTSAPKAFASTSYTVKSGDSLWTISRTYSVTVQAIKDANNLSTDSIFIGQTLVIPTTTTTNTTTPTTTSATTSTASTSTTSTTTTNTTTTPTTGTTSGTNTTTENYTVKSGDSLWIISKAFGVTIDSIRTANKLTSDNLYIGQVLIISKSVTAPTSNTTTTPTTSTTNGTNTTTENYTVKSGDTLWIISKTFGVTIDSIKTANKLTSDNLYIGQVLIIEKSTTPTTNTTNTTTTTTPPTLPTTNLKPGEGVSWSSLQSYVVQSGEYGSVLAKKFNVPLADLLKYNYMTENDWFYVGQKIAINGYAPREYSVIPGESSGPQNYGKLVDWYLDGQYYLKRDVIVEIIDIKTRLSFKAKVLGGVNHPDLEPIDAANTAIMKQLFPVWDWTPRPVVLYYNGMNIAASLSGMPHGVDSTPNNEVSGHFDCYLKNSTPHSSTTSQTYIQQHYTNVQIASQVR